MLRIGKKHIKHAVIAVSAAVLAVIGSTMAFLSSEDDTTNQLTGGRLDIELTETKWDPGSGLEVMPGDELPKNPQVVNVEQTDGYIFLRVTVPGDAQMIDQDNGLPLGSIGSNVPMYKFMVYLAPDVYAADKTFTPKQTVNTSWKLISDNDEGYTSYDAEKKQFVYVYAYADGNALVPLKKGETTEPLFDKLQLWNFNENFDSESDHSVRVEAFGIQADLSGYTAEQIKEIWGLLEEGGSG